MSVFYELADGLYRPLPPAALRPTAAAAGLLSRALEQAPTSAPLRPVRITIDLQDPLPSAPLAVRTRVVRDGKRQQLVEAELWVEGRIAGSALGLMVCDGEGPEAPPRSHADPLPAAGDPVAPALGARGPIETRTLPRTISGAAAWWTRVGAQLVAGETPSLIQRAVMACDLGVSACHADADARPVMDLAVYLVRGPVGDWVLADAQTDDGGEGYAQISSVLFDTAGMFGYAHQSCLEPQRGRI